MQQRRKKRNREKSYLELWARVLLACCFVAVILSPFLSTFLLAMWTHCVCVSFATSCGALLGVLRLKSLGFCNRHMIEKWGTPVEPGTSCSCLSAAYDWSSAARPCFCSTRPSLAAPRFVSLLRSKAPLFSSQRTLTPAQCAFSKYSILFFIYYLFVVCLFIYLRILLKYSCYLFIGHWYCSNAVSPKNSIH